MTENQTPATGLSRRSVTQGLAWSVPAVAVASAAPALAGSTNCTTDATRQGGLLYDWGAVDATTTTQVMNLGAGGFTVTGLEPGVTVVSIELDYYIQQRDGQSTAGPGAFYPGNTSVVKSDIGYVGTSSSGTLTPIKPTPNRSINTSVKNDSRFTPTATNAWAISTSGWNQTIQATNNLTQTFRNPDGTTYTANAWKLDFSWTASKDTQSTYTTGADGCVTFNSGSSGRFNITYQNVVASKSTDPWAQDGSTIPQNIQYTITLSDGSVITRQTYVSVITPK